MLEQVEGPINQYIKRRCVNCYRENSKKIAKLWVMYSRYNHGLRK